MDVNISKVLPRETLKVFKDIVTFPNSTYRDRKERLQIDLSAIHYHANKLIDMDLVAYNKGKLSGNVSCKFCGRKEVCVGTYPEGCFLDNEF